MEQQFTKSLGQLTEVVKGLVDDVPSLKKSVSDLSEVVTKQAEMLDKLSTASLGRKSVANYVALEKSFANTEVAKNDEEIVDKFMKEGMTFGEAYRQLKIQKSQM